LRASKLTSKPPLHFPNANHSLEVGFVARVAWRQRVALRLFSLVASIRAIRLFIAHPILGNASAIGTSEFTHRALTVFAVLLVGSIGAVRVTVAFPNLWHAVIVRLALEFVGGAGSSGTILLVGARWAVDFVVASEEKLELDQQIWS
jgi:hypothetical protein